MLMPRVCLRKIMLGLFLGCLGTAAWAVPNASACAQSAQGIPSRAAQADGAQAIVRAIAGLSDHERDGAIRRQLLAGNIPDFLRRAVPVMLTAHLAGGRAARLTLCVLSDYLSLGADDDYLRVPVGLETAMAVAARYGFALPTRRIVDLIYQQASMRLAPQPLPAGDQMRSTAYLLRHEALVDTQMKAQMKAQAPSPAAQPSALMAGHKKDLVLTERLWQQPGRVAIYGWHRENGSPIQPLSTVHGARYADYSHGLRLVSQVVWVDGQPRSLFELLADPRWAPALSDEGPLPHVLALTAAAAE
jgi:hypothetical protein